MPSLAMKADIRLDSAVFQLTPTRTRCDLIIAANGKTEKMTSGLLNPFLAHLRIAQDQVSKGGYSIVLEPKAGCDATWFTKGTVEKFVRFVGTPEILERVYTIESEILQIKEALANQSNIDSRLSSVDECSREIKKSMEGTKPVLKANEEKAIVLYTPGAHQPEANQSSENEGDSKVQLLRVLETRKTVLQKEQGMAFARAVAAGFDIDHIPPLISFSESFGALRLMEACLRFMNLWRRKHETGQWFEIEATKELPCSPDIPRMDASGIMFASVTNKPQEHSEAKPTDQGPEYSYKANAIAGDKIPINHHVPLANHEYLQGQHQYPIFSPWPTHSPAAMPVFQSYPVQGFPYYQNYPGNNPYFQPPYQCMEDPRSNIGQILGQKKDISAEAECLDENAAGISPHDDLQSDKQISQSHQPRKKAIHSSNEHSGRMVNQNINYISSKGQNLLDSESQPDYDSLTGGDVESEDADLLLKNKNSFRSSKTKESHKNFVDTLNSRDEESIIQEKEIDGNQWNTFQNYLLRNAAADDKWVKDGDISWKKDIEVRQCEVSAGDDLLVPKQTHEGQMYDFQSISGNVVCMPESSNDDIFISRREDQFVNDKVPVDGHKQFTEFNGSGGSCKRVASDDFIFNGQEIQSGFRGSSDPLAVYDIESSTKNLDKNLSLGPDESFILPSRSDLIIQHQIDHRAALNMDSELLSQIHKTDDDLFIRESCIHEPIDLCLVPGRGLEKSSVGYDSSFDFKIQGCIGDDAAMMANKNNEVADVDCVSNKFVEPKVSDKKKLWGGKKGKPSKWSPSDEARARAERLRSFKLDLQKVKKEKEEESIKRLESLKIARQKRIGARSGPMPSSSSPSQLSSKPLLNKHSPISKKLFNFKDSEPVLLSPILKVSKRNLSLSSSNSPIISKPGISNNNSHLLRSKLSRSMSSSFPVSKNENEIISPDPKASMKRIRRLSEPRKSTSFLISPVKSRSTSIVSKGKSPDGPERKKISEIITLDKSRSAALPELKIRISKGPPVGIQNISVASERKKQDNEASSFMTACEVENLNRKDNSIIYHNDIDDNPVIGKKAATLECGKPYPPSVCASGEIKVLDKDHAPIHAMVSEKNKDGFDRKSIHQRLPEQAIPCQVTTGYEPKEAPILHNTPMVENSYQAPFARNSSFEEDACTKISEFGKSQQSFETSTSKIESAKALIPDFKNLKLEKIPEALEKSQVKEPSKGFKRLLKFGRKDHHYPATVDSSEINVVLKGSDSTAAPSNGGSRTFSLLSPLARLAKRN